MINDTLIEKYFSKSLTPNEALEFDKLYESDSSFKKDVDFLKTVKSVSEKEDDLQFKSQLKSYEDDYSEHEKKTTYKWLKPLVAATGIIIIMLSINFFMNSSMDEEQLFSSYFEPSKNVTSPIVRSTDTETTINNAFIAYSDADYKQAILLFQAAYQDSKNSELLFYEANALLALDHSEKAITKFEEHLKYTDILTNRSHWYLALAFIKTKQLEKAKLELQRFLNSDETFKKQEAISLLKELD